MRRSILGAMTAIGVFFAPMLAVAQTTPQLIMVEQAGCIYCAIWDKEIAHIYPKTAEGQFAPLWRVDIADLPPEGVAIDRKVNFTPTFILIEEGREIARLEGYPGEDFFWGLLAQMLRDHTDFSEGAS